jgi:hydrogenase nickel incorporation protein HypA/HybF
MHELSICQALISQVGRIAAEQGATVVDRIVLSIGPLSGVEAPLLQNAFTVARAGTVAEIAEMEIRTGPVVVECVSCGARGEVPVNRLLCPSCNGWQVRVVSGDDLLLLSIDLSGIPQETEPATAHAPCVTPEGRSEIRNP